MLHRLGSLFIAFVMLSGSLSAQAVVYRCQAIFRPSLYETLMTIDREHQGQLFKKDLSVLTEDLSWNRRRQLRAILKYQFLGNAISEREVARLATELTALIFGKRDIVDNYIFKTQDQRTTEAFSSLMNEKIIKEGLLQAWGGQYSPEKTGALSGLVKSLRWTNDKITMVGDFVGRTPLALPLMLPKLKNREISDELIQKVLLEGVDKHIEEIRIAMKAQNRIDAYNVFRRLYAPVILGSALTIMTVIGYMQAVQANDEMVRRQLAGLDEMHDVIDQLRVMQNAIIEDAVSSAREEFIQKWGEPPTSEEEVELRNKIINGITKRAQGREQ